VTDLASSPWISASPWMALPATQTLLSRAAVAGDHTLLHRIRSGAAHADDIAEWVQSRVYLAEYQARKDILVLSKLSDRDARRRWTLRLLAIDGHGDFYGPSKQGLLESWRRLREQVCSPTRPSSGALTAALDHLFDTQLVRVQNASWIESLGSTLVDDWVARNDCEIVGVLPAEKTLPVSSRRDFQLFNNHLLSANTLVALETQLGVAMDQGLLKQVLKSIEVRVRLEHAILEATHQSTLAH
jgi:hypothetical protein